MESAQDNSVAREFAYATEWPTSLLVTSTKKIDAEIDRLAVNCNAQFTIEYDIPVLCVSIVCFLLGLVYSFFGYRFFKAVLFLTGLIFGSILIYLICDKEKLLPQLGNAGVALGAGILFGLVTMLVEYVGVFMSGFLSGLFVGIVIMLILYFASPPTTLWVTIGVLFFSGLVLALVTLKWQRIFMILGTALMGGAMVSTSLDYVANKFGVIGWIWSVLNIEAADYRTICWYGWVIFGLWPAIFVVGALVQWRLTSVGFSHKDGSRAGFYRKQQQRRSPSAQRLTSDPRVPDLKVQAVKAHIKAGSSRSAHQIFGSNGSNPRSNNVEEHLYAEPAETGYQPKPFRHLYQMRKNQGDVICQSYMESLQRLQQGQTTLSSDQTKQTIISTTRSNRSTYSEA